MLNNDLCEAEDIVSMSLHKWSNHVYTLVIA